MNLLEKTNNSRVFGHYCTAIDGHNCRSRAEKYIDCWLYKRNIKLECEPEYPYDKELNKHGYKADFLVGNTFIEYFGLMNQNDYKNKSKIKRELAKKYGKN